MTDQATPLVPAVRVRWRDRVLRWCVAAALRASLIVSPRPAAWLLRRVFAAGGAQMKKVVDRHAPSDVVALVDEPYGDEDDMLLDVLHPAAVTEALPLVLWVHGGGWVGGAKGELTSYFKIIASHGYVVVAPRYSLAPEHLYPTPLRQLMQALAHLQANAERLHIDPGRIALAGDSAGAQLAAELGVLTTTPGYSDTIDVACTITAAQLRGVVLACGPYDLALARQVSTTTGRLLIIAILWAYLGTRDALDDPSSGSWSVTENVTAAFPPALITVGNADPLQPHSELLAAKLTAQGVETETLFWPADRRPPLGHEYQFDLDTEPGQRFLTLLLDFLARRLSMPLP